LYQPILSINLNSSQFGLQWRLDGDDENLNFEKYESVTDWDGLITITYA